MAHEDLIKSIESAAEERNWETISNAEREIDKIIADAEAEASSIQVQYLEKAKKNLTLEKNRQRFLTNQEIKREISSVREDLIEDAFLKAKESLSEIRSDNQYSSFYSSLIREIFDALPGEEVTLHIDPADSRLCREIIQDLSLKCQIIEDITTIGGLCGSSSDELIQVSNTLESRLENVRTQCGMEIVSVLLGESDG